MESSVTSDHGNTVEVDELLQTGHEPAGRSRGDWIRRFLAGNPFYMVSAALLLLGINRLVVDPDFLGAETPKLIFSFSALQIYEVLLVGVAVFLARRKIWYDSTLLVVLESALVLVSFILVTQAVLIGRGLALALCLGGAVLAVARWGGARLFIRELNLPTRLLGLGLVVLAANLALPFIFRPIMEEDVQDWEIPSHYAWMLALPLLQLLAMGLPRPSQWGGLAMQRSWLPLLMFTLLIAASGVHLYCVGYVCNLSLEPFLLAPVLWAAAWTVYHRLTDFLPAPSAKLRAALLFPPAMATLLALSHSRLFLTLTVLNIGLYGSLCVFGRDRRVAVQLLGASCAALVAAMPPEAGSALLPEFSRGKAIAFSLGASALLYAVASRRVGIGICGAILAALTPRFLFEVPTTHLAGQVGAVFLLLHSLRWGAPDPVRIALLRGAVALAWIVDAFMWTRNLEAMAISTVCGGAGLVLGVCWLAWLLTGQCKTRILPVAAFLVLMTTPAHCLFSSVSSVHPGVLAVAGSFLLLALGTALALTKHRWNRLTAASSDESPGKFHGL